MHPTPDDGPKRLDFPEAASYLGIKERYLRRLVQEKRLPHYKLGDGKRSPLLFEKSDLDEWLASRKIHAVV